MADAAERCAQAAGHQAEGRPASAPAAKRRTTGQDGAGGEGQEADHGRGPQWVAAAFVADAELLTGEGLQCTLLVLEDVIGHLAGVRVRRSPRPGTWCTSSAAPVSAWRRARPGPTLELVAVVLGAVLHADPLAKAHAEGAGEQARNAREQDDVGAG
ncbi:MAG: hypothetical protein U5Q44_13695 [Dehalococcoidia bacterium]|nr:hypothetical protein [Dehalococcoidia bacterium]